jgi:hypothetical protein
MALRGRKMVMMVRDWEPSSGVFDMNWRAPKMAGVIS